MELLKDYEVNPCDVLNLKFILSKLRLDEMIPFINQIDSLFGEEMRGDYTETVINSIKDSRNRIYFRTVTKAYLLLKKRVSKIRLTRKGVIVIIMSRILLA